MRKLLLPLLLLPVWSLASAQDLAFDHLSVEQGLSRTWVHALAKDGRGFLWIGTESGIDRYDGQRIVNYRLPTADGSGLANTRVNNLHVDRAGEIWVASGAGLHRYDRVRDRFERVPLPGDQGSGSVQTLDADEAGRLWVGTDRGLVRLEIGRQAASWFRSDAKDPRTLASGNVASVLVGRSGEVWVATGVGVDRIDPGSGRVTHVSLGTAVPGVTHLHQDASGTVWVSSQSGGGLFSIQPRNGSVTRYLPEPGRPGTIGTARVLCTASDGRGHLFVGTENGGLEVLDLATGTFRRYTPRRGDDRSLGGASVYALLHDDQGILWAGTYNGGVSYTSETQSRFGLVQARREDELSDPHVSAVLLDRNGELWVGTDGGGLNRIRPGAIRTVVYRHDPRDATTVGSDAILTLLEDRAGRLWLGGWDAGIGLIDRQTGRATTYRHQKGSGYDHIFRLLEDGPRHFMVASFAGLERFDTEARTFAPVVVRGGAIPSPLYALARDGKGDLWLGAAGGAFRIEQGTNRIVAMPYDPKDPSSFGPGGADAFLLDSRNNFWVGFDGGGLRCLPAVGGGVRAWTTAEGLSGDGVKDILEDESGNLWVSTDRGLSKIEGAVSLPEAPSVVNFDVADGLQGQEFRYGAAFKSRSGEMFFGGQKGLNRFLPSRIRLNPQPPNVVLTGLRLFNKPQTVDTPGSPLTKATPELRELRLRYDQSVVTFEFAALNLVLPKKNRYAYRLEPLEPQWNEVGAQTTANYTLSPDEYVFRVKAANNDGVWNEKGLELRVTVTPPWWRHPLFETLAGLAVVGGAFGWYLWRVRAMAQRHRELEAIVAERTSELASSADSLRAKGEALARENEERRRAEQEARRAAEQTAEANRSLEEHRAELEREVAERQKAEQEAGRERDLLHALMDSIPDLIYFKDAQSRFTRVNRAQASALGLPSPEAAVGRCDLDFFPAEFARGTIDEERKLMRTAQPLLGHLEHDVQRDRWFLATKVPLHDAAGRVNGLVGISKDMTDFKRAEERLERELSDFLATVNTVSQGDLTHRGRPGDDTVGRIASGVNAMLESFSGILAHVRDTVLAVSTSSTEILAAATQIAKGAEHGSEQVQNTSAAVEQMAASMGQVSHDSDASAAAAMSVLEHVREGEASVDAAHQGMARIDAAVGETAEKMKLLERRSREIFEVIDLIQEIAAQSELLALNAAIQAAHAGEAGRGFSVVADEIRRLAERSKEASRDVSRIVEGIVAEVQTVLGAMRLAMQEVTADRELSGRARSSLQEIESLVARSVQLASQISLASREQAQATRTVSDSMQSISSITIQSAAGARETSRAVEYLVQLSEQLTEAIARFRFGEGSKR